MPQFRVTLNFSVNIHDAEDVYTTYEESRSECRAKQGAFQRTSDYYEKHNIVDSIKKNSAMDMVEYILCEGEVKSAKWDAANFAIHMVVETDQTAEDLCEELQMNSLEDGEYEACGESGWILFTRDEEGNVFQGGMGMSDVWEYALVDYRDNPIEIEEVV
jgi:hypothetical protein